MRMYGKAVRLLATTALLAGFVASSQAALISVVPGSQTIAPGGTANIDIVLSGLGANEVVGGFSFLLSYNNAILGAPATFTANPGNVMGAAPLDLSGGFTGLGGSPLDVFVLADAAISSADLKTAEGAGFTLATVHLTGLTEGLSALTLSVSPSQGAFLSDFLGEATIPTVAANGSVCVDDPATPGNRCISATVPEPGTLILSLLGAVAFIGGRRKARA
jgi:hypothetical protein